MTSTTTLEVGQNLIHRLRETDSKGVSVWGDLQKEAADAIEALQAENAGLRSECADLKRQWTEWSSSLASVMKQRNDLKEERDELQADYQAKCSELELVHESRNALQAKLATLEADAERYRWLASRHFIGVNNRLPYIAQYPSPESHGIVQMVIEGPDAAIDAARAKDQSA